MKIALISTAYPLRGGIAQYTGILYRKLREKGHTVNVLTFKRQYPKLLFPGKTQLETSQDDSVKIESEPMLDSIGPLTWFRAYRRVRELGAELVVFKYWMPFFAPCYGTICWLLKRFTNIRISFVCHNIIPHERRIGDIMLTKFAFRHVDFFIVQSSVVERELLSLFPEATYKLVPHPVYDIFGNVMEKQTARNGLGLREEKVILFFGYVRAYKGLDLLIDAMPRILARQKVKLIIVGEFYDDEKKYRNQVARLNLTEHVHMVSEFVPNEKVSLYFSAADVVVLPYKSATQSGIVQLAYHLNKPCIVTDVGGLAEVVLHEKTGFVVPPDDPEAIAEAVLRFYSENREDEFSQNVEREKLKYSWENMVSAIEELAMTER